MMNRILAIRLLEQQALSYEEAMWKVWEELPPPSINIDFKRNFKRLLK